MATTPPHTPDPDTFNCPVSAAKIHRLLDASGLSRGSEVFDAGCGTGELLILAGERHRSGGVGIDLDARAVERARSSAVARGADRVRFLVGDASTFEHDQPFDLAACLGATHVFAGLAGTVTALTRVVRDGGRVLVGDIYWKRPPDPDYLAVLGETADAHTTHAGNVAVGVGAGLTPVYATTAADDEWDHFESSFWGRRLQAALEAPSSEERAKRIESLRRWQDAYFKWGRDTMGFGVYLFRKLP